MSKKQLGAFYTTNSDRILRKFTAHIKGKDVVDPCCGNRDLLNWAEYHGAASVLGYDINPQTPADVHQDTIMNVPDYTDKFLLTNPPYLGRNKSHTKAPYVKWGVNDLYKAAIRSYISSGVTEGILIVPTNIFVDEDVKFRKEVFSNWEILDVVLFNDQVFEDTPVKVCAFHFVRGTTTSLFNCPIDTSSEGKYRVGTEWFDLLSDSFGGVGRLLEGETPTTRINLRAMDTGSAHGRIALTYGDEPYYGKQTDRQFCTISLTTKLTAKQQKELVETFNTQLNLYRDRYHSMFLVNGLPVAGKERKRIGFRTVYKFIHNYIQNL